MSTLMGIETLRGSCGIEEQCEIDGCTGEWDGSKLSAEIEMGSMQGMMQVCSTHHCELVERESL
jgi:hypothetical protein